MATPIDELLKKYDEQNLPAYNKLINTLTESVDKQKESINANAQESLNLIEQEGAKQETEVLEDYGQIIDAQNVQKLINERKLKESMGNAGLTDSGLNRTQQTATQLSYANAVSKAQIAKQNAVDSIAEWVRNNKMEVETNRSDAVTTLESNLDTDIANKQLEYEQNKTTSAWEQYNAEVDQDRLYAEDLQESRTEVWNAINKPDITKDQITAALNLHLMRFDDEDFAKYINENVAPALLETAKKNATEKQNEAFAKARSEFITNITKSGISVSQIAALYADYKAKYPYDEAFATDLYNSIITEMEIKQTNEATSAQNNARNDLLAKVVGKNLTAAELHSLFATYASQYPSDKEWAQTTYTQYYNELKNETNEKNKNAVENAKNEVINTILTKNLSNAKLKTLIDDFKAKYPNEKKWADELYQSHYNSNEGVKTAPDAIRENFLAGWNDEGPSEDNVNRLKGLITSYPRDPAWQNPLQETINSMVADLDTDPTELSNTIETYLLNYGTADTKGNVSADSFIKKLFNDPNFYNNYDVKTDGTIVRKPTTAKNQTGQVDNKTNTYNYVDENNEVKTQLGVGSDATTKGTDINGTNNSTDKEKFFNAFKNKGIDAFMELRNDQDKYSTLSIDTMMYNKFGDIWLLAMATNDNYSGLNGSTVVETNNGGINFGWGIDRDAEVEVNGTKKEVDEWLQAAKDLGIKTSVAKAFLKKYGTGK